MLSAHFIMSKPFKTYEEQIQLLKSRGMIFENESEAIRILETDNYYNLINGYKDAFIIQGSENYTEGTEFTYIKYLYQFDKGLRHSILSTLLDVETMLKSIISYEFAKDFGECAYLDKNSYNTYNQNSQQLAETLINSLNSLINQCKDNLDMSNDNIRHYLNVHNEIPIWVLMTHMNLADLSKMYQCLKPQTKKHICTHLESVYGNHISTQDMYIFFRILSNVRNLCAHNLRLYTYKTKFVISPQNDAVIQLKKHIGTGLSYNNIISIAIIFYHLIDKNSFSEFINGFKEELKHILDIPSKFAVVLAKKQNYSLYDFIIALDKLEKREWK